MSMSNLTIFSKAMFGTFSYYSPIRAMFDCGPGASNHFGNHVYAPESIFIGHSCHNDHIGDLPSFVGARAHCRGDKEKDLNIYYPESRNMTLMIDYISKLHYNLPYKLNFIEINPGFTKTFDNGLSIEAFAVKHAYKSMGYKILEKRSRLKAGIKPEDARALAASGQVINEAYWANVFTYTLDSASYDLKHIENCAWLIADSCFISPKDREDLTHASCEEVMRWAKDSNVKRISLAHWSCRYSWQDIQRAVPEIQKNVGYYGQVDAILPNRVWEL